MNQVYRGLFVIWVCAGIAACAATAPNLPPQSDEEIAKGPSVLVDAYQMAVGDNVRITVWKNSELSISEPIRPDGKIAVPLVGDVVAAGKTPEELAADITVALSNYIKNPNVTVVLTGLKGHQFLSRIRVTGAVGSDTSMEYQQGMTVLDAVLEAGSVDLYADANNTKLHRRTEEGAVTYDIRLKDIMEDGDMTTNVYLLPGDVITVPERLF
jgi:polysaccharide export outer membrane protein